MTIEYMTRIEEIDDSDLSILQGFLGRNLIFERGYRFHTMDKSEKPLVLVHLITEDQNGKRFIFMSEHSDEKFFIIGKRKGGIHVKEYITPFPYGVIDDVLDSLEKAYYDEILSANNFYNYHQSLQIVT